MNAWWFLGSLTLTFIFISPPQNPIVYSQLDCNMLIWSRKYLWEKKINKLKEVLSSLMCDCISQKDETIMKDTTKLLSTCVISWSLRKKLNPHMSSLHIFFSFSFLYISFIFFLFYFFIFSYINSFTIM